jgi:hypothetical protein
MHWFRYGKGGGEMISMTSREAASHFFADVNRAIAREAPDIRKVVEIPISMVSVWFCLSSPGEPRESDQYDPSAW